MKFNKGQLSDEEFNQLKQLDRIEFRQKYNEIEEDFSFNPFTGITNVLSWGVALGFLSGLIIATKDPQAAFPVIRITAHLLSITICFGLLSIGRGLVNNLNEKKQKQKLIDEYFEKKKPKGAKQ